MFLAARASSAPDDGHVYLFACCENGNKKEPQTKKTVAAELSSANRLCNVRTSTHRRVFNSFARQQSKGKRTEADDDAKHCHDCARSRAPSSCVDISIPGIDFVRLKLTALIECISRSFSKWNDFPCSWIIPWWTGANEFQQLLFFARKWINCYRTFSAGRTNQFRWFWQHPHWQYQLTIHAMIFPIYIFIHWQTPRQDNSSILSAIKCHRK